MTTTDAALRQKVTERIRNYEHLVKKDVYRQHFHLMPPVGLLNDPNGLIQWKGIYHVFYQWQPFKTGHGAKFWGHYTSTDLVNWQHEEAALAPSDWFDQNGCYSGSAVIDDGHMYVMYTGNVRDEQGNRETYQCLAVSEDGIHFQKKGVVATLPEGFTAHFRDPKVWKRNGKWYMVLGAQSLNLKGNLVLFTSDTLDNWTFQGIIAGSGKNGLEDFGYMWECPDLFELDGRDVLIVSPQGLKPDGLKYHNTHQSGYFVGRLDDHTYQYTHGAFEELDRGFDFYAQQTFLDESGRRILIGWMGVPDQGEEHHPTISYQWIHCLTIPRELRLDDDGHLIQKPVTELQAMRTNEQEHIFHIKRSVQSIPVDDITSAELFIDQIDTQKGFECCIRAAARIIYDKGEGKLTLERDRFEDRSKEVREVAIDELHDLHIFIDASSIEIFVNGGRKVLTARYFPSPGNKSISISGRNETKLKLKTWHLQREAGQ
ncbi:sucrose-6-phosphate hydrolase [Bacillus sp. FSL M8-0266]|uniref:glycoside hydrolase family 32 protein n=1 Tax=Bacillus TaxID=1386 RepID=UPI001614AB5C|nr:sucrose-6-phosphate hydrolase [Bacillus pumilus]MBB6602818.1 sucrose-6-phosphate hydrolase [Bacillus pumilus]MCY7572180.1 sucrose-6-phosphate hydrolase [Bacillus pumilus]MEC3761759.1 sucrose-6-phosphate hydrolase [Bacillus pumilus]